MPQPQPRNGGHCPYCDRIMSVREGQEQGACNDCCDERGIERPTSNDIGYQ